MLHRVCFLLFTIVLLAGCTDGTERRLQLEELERQNRADSVMHDLVLAQSLADYFDRHGTRNEQLRAHYILGRTYADQGETPRAVDCYLDAVAKADTTSADCDYHTLGCAYSQMADMFHSQLLLTNELKAREQSRYYAEKAGETLNALSDLKLSAGAYILLNKQDTAEVILNDVVYLYMNGGYEQEAIQASLMLMYLYVDRPEKLAELKLLINQYDNKSSLFDGDHELPPYFRQFYYYKGKYYEGINRLDSAEYFYRKISGHNMPYVAMNPMYKGLLSVFAKRHIADSVAKYSKLYCETNDSSIAIKDQEITAQMAASYNYNNIQKEALANKSKAYRLLVMLVLSASLLVVLILAGAYGYNLYKKKRQEQIRAHAEEIQQLKVEFADATESYEENLHELRLLEGSRKKVIDIIQSELNGLSKEKETYKTKYTEAQRTIARINEEYELNSTTLRKENQELHRKIDELKSKEGISEHLAASVEFAKTEAVQQAKALAHDPLATMTSEQWHALVQAFGQHFPQLYSDLVRRDVTPSAMRVCVLTVIGLRTNEQSNLMGIQKQVVTNYKTALNNLLFGEKTSRTLTKNLISQYNAFIV